MFKKVGNLLGSSLKEKRNKEQEFFEAVVAGELHVIGQLIKAGVNRNALNSDDITALHVAAERGDMVVGRYLLTEKLADVNFHSLTRNNETPLITAITFNHLPFIHLLLQHGADLNLRNIFGRSPLHMAVRQKSLPAVKTLLYSKADPNVFDSFGNTPLSYSFIEYRSSRIAETLLKWGADPNIRTMKPHPLLLEVALNQKNHDTLNMVKLLIEFKADLDITNLISQQTALHIVSITGVVPLARLLLKHGAKHNLKDRNGRTPYQLAVEHQQEGLIRLYKERERVVQDIFRSISFVAPNKVEPLSISSIISKKNRSQTRRSVRFTESRESEMDSESQLLSIYGD